MTKDTKTINIKDSADKANLLHKELLEGNKVEVPDIDFNDPIFNISPGLNDIINGEIPKLTIEELTSRQVDGTGVMDAILESVKNHLDEQFKLERFEGSQFADIYTRLFEVGITNAVQFLISKDGAYWNAISAQLGAYRARVDLETSKYQLMAMRFSALKEEAEFTNIKMQTLNHEIQYESAKYTFDNILPANFELINEQIEAQRAQTLDNRTDGSEVKGYIGKQKELYDQQIVAYMRDSEYKLGKLYSDVFITMRTGDTDLSPPTNFQNSGVDNIFNQIKERANFTG